jgi:hypothetical protein
MSSLLKQLVRIGAGPGRSVSRVGGCQARLTRRCLRAYLNRPDSRETQRVSVVPAKGSCVACCCWPRLGEHLPR